MTFTSLVPLAHVRSVTRSIAFYRKLGFVVRNTHTPEGAVDPVWAWLESGGAYVMLGQATEAAGPAPPAVMFYLYCDEVVAMRNTLVEAGLDVGPIHHPFYAPGGEFRVTDPDGYVLMVTHT